MAVGDRKIVMQGVNIGAGNPVPYIVYWKYMIEDKANVDHTDSVQPSGQTNGTLGTPAEANAKTLTVICNEAALAISVDPNIPDYDVIINISGRNVIVTPQKDSESEPTP